jgi:sporulation protein YhbH
MEHPSTFAGCREADQQWYDLFSRGARDWLRHNEKVRRAVREKLPEVLSNADIFGGDGSRTVKVPVRLLEHFRFRLREAEEIHGAGQGDVKPGDKLGRPGQQESDGQSQGGNNEGGVQLVLELKIDDIVDWLWEELKLPNLQAKSGATQDDDYTREGWSRRGVRSRLDRRRSMKESLKRRSVDPAGPTFTDEDLRFRQLVMRRQPATQAVIFFVMDVSSSMRDRDRQLAKTFFFWVVQGLRRQYTRLEPVFVAHTVKAWEFPESEFFQVRGSGGTVASSAFAQVKQIIDDRYDPARYNIYLFYASDGENFKDDHETAAQSLKAIADVASFVGYVETPASDERALETETAAIFQEAAEPACPMGSYALTSNESVWDAIRAFFQEQVAATAG